MNVLLEALREKTTNTIPIKWHNDKPHVEESIHDRMYRGLINGNGYHPITTLMCHKVNDDRFESGVLAYVPVRPNQLYVVCNLKVSEGDRYMISARIYRVHVTPESETATLEEVDRFNFRYGSIHRLAEKYQKVASVAWENLVWWKNIATEESFVVRARMARLEGHRSCVRILSQTEGTPVRFTRSGENFMVRAFNQPAGLYHVSLTRKTLNQIQFDLTPIPTVKHRELLHYSKRHMGDTPHHLVEITLRSGFKSKGLFVEGIGYRFIYRYGHEMRAVHVEDEMINNVVTI